MPKNQSVTRGLGVVTRKCKGYSSAKSGEVVPRILGDEQREVEEVTRSKGRKPQKSWGGGAQRI